MNPGVEASATAKASLKSDTAAETCIDILREVLDESEEAPAPVDDDDEDVAPDVDPAGVAKEA